MALAFTLLSSLYCVVTKCLPLFLLIVHLDVHSLALQRLYVLVALQDALLRQRQTLHQLSLLVLQHRHLSMESKMYSQPGDVSKVGKRCLARKWCVHTVRQ